MDRRLASHSENVGLTRNGRCSERLNASFTRAEHRPFLAELLECTVRHLVRYLFGAHTESSGTITTRNAE
jgi:hypothetical protein